MLIISCSVCALQELAMLPSYLLVTMFRCCQRYSDVPGFPINLKGICDVLECYASSLLLFSCLFSFSYSLPSSHSFFLFLYISIEALSDPTILLKPIFASLCHKVSYLGTKSTLSFPFVISNSAHQNFLSEF